MFCKKSKSFAIGKETKAVVTKESAPSVPSDDWPGILLVERTREREESTLVVDVFHGEAHLRSRHELILFGELGRVDILSADGCVEDAERLDGAVVVSHFRDNAV